MSYQTKTIWQRLTVVRLLRSTLRVIAGLGYLEARLWLWFWRGSAWSLAIVGDLLIGLGKIVHDTCWSASRASGAAIFWPLRRVAKLFVGAAGSLDRLGAGLASASDQAAKQAKRLADQTLHGAANVIEDIKSVKVRPRKAMIRPVFAYAVLLLMIISPIGFYRYYRELLYLKDKLFASASAAISDIKGAKEAAEGKDFGQAAGKFAQAGQNFLQAENDLGEVNSVLFSLAQVAPNEKLRMAAAAPALTEAGRFGAELGKELSAAVEGLLSDNQANLTLRLDRFVQHGRRAVSAAEGLEAAIAKIDSRGWSDEYRQQFDALADKARFIKTSLVELMDIGERLQTFLGSQYDKRYLLVFQNNTEARATGGFMGSFSVVDFSRGQIKQMVTPGGGTYDTEGGARHLEAAPEPLRLVRGRWHLWDANWWPDWPTSASKIMWFYEKSDGSTVDGVISLTPQVVADILKLTGPIHLPNFKETVDADNFVDVLQYYAEQQNGPTDKPKAIVGDLSGALIEALGSKLNSKEGVIKLIGSLENSLNQKDILLYFTDEELAKKVADNGWDGRLKSSTGDYLQVVNTNIAGGKSDKKILQSIDHWTDIGVDGTIINTVTIRRQHTAVRGELFTGVRNVNWLRVYVPLGAQLISAQGFKVPEAKYFDQADPNWSLDPRLENERLAERHQSGTKIYREADKTVFANWSMVDPGETAEIKLVYKLPFKLEALPQERQSWQESLRRFRSGQPDAQLYKYTLLTQKQSGTHNSRWRFRLTMPDYQQIIWKRYDQDSRLYQLQEGDNYQAFLISDK